MKDKKGAKSPVINKEFELNYSINSSYFNKNEVKNSLILDNKLIYNTIHKKNRLLDL